jgi:membrane protein YdbS with pleckstrin-like domain
MEPSTARYLMHNILGEPGTMTRLVQYSSTAAFLFLPLAFILPSLRHQPAAFWSVVVGGAVFIYFAVVWVTDRLYAWLQRTYDS